MQGFFTFIRIITASIYNGTLYVWSKTIDVFIEMEEIKNPEHGACALNIQEGLKKYGTHGGYYISWCLGKDRDSNGLTRLWKNNYERGDINDSFLCSHLD